MLDLRQGLRRVAFMCLRVDQQHMRLLPEVVRLLFFGARVFEQVQRFLLVRQRLGRRDRRRALVLRGVIGVDRRLPGMLVGFARAARSVLFVRRGTVAVLARVGHGPRQIGRRQVWDHSRTLDSAGQGQNHDDQQHEAQAAAGTVSPTPAMRPRRNGPQQHQHRDHD
jgi:hypothetical protein